MADYRKWRIAVAAGPVLGLCAGVGGAAAAPEPLSLNLKLEPEGAQAAKISTYAVRLPLAVERPAGLRKEPDYRGTPRYAVVRIGNGDPLPVVVAVDEPAGGDARIYVDRNANGDLTDDGDGAWSAKAPVADKVRLGPSPFRVRGSWKGAGGQAVQSEYGISLSRLTGTDYLSLRSLAARVGEVTLDGKTHRALLVENDADGLFAKPVETNEKGEPVEKPKTNPVSLYIDLNDDGQFRGSGAAAESFDVRAPFQVAGTTYEAVVAPDGSQLRLSPTTRVAANLRPQLSDAARAALAKLLANRNPNAPAATRPELLKAGTPAPDFTADAWGGGSVKLSDFKGKVVVLDFWATWCGPCMRSMPHLEKVHRAVKNQNVVVLAVCVSDEREAYNAWVPANQDKYTYRFAFDPAGRDRTKPNISRGLFNVSGIPTTYVIDKEGKVVDAIVGYRDGDTRLEEALKKVGVDAGGEGA